MRGALKFYKTAARKQGETMNYHSSDSLALSVLVEEIAGKPLSDVFHQHISRNLLVMAICIGLPINRERP